ncbi:MAG: hypoxanthine phosphoribosyltransferase [Deltaproteobacteria bacterium]|nr:MAG: hypoxanthine phosphoribosyltransferase [Deltaproteobacteria bacterium]
MAEDLKILFTKEEIAKATAKIAEEINRDYEGREVVLLGILTGAFLFLADLVRLLTVDCKIDFVRLSSYGNETASSGRVEKLMSHKLDLTGANVIVVEEVVDTGLTLSYFLEDLKSSGPREVKVCSLVDKRELRQKEIGIDYTGFVIEDGFLLGYGMDLAERLRNLPDIRVKED